METVTDLTLDEPSQDEEDYPSDYPDPGPMELSPDHETDDADSMR